MKNQRIVSLRTVASLWLTVVCSAFAMEYYVDGATGNDSNDGLSTASAFQSFSKGYSTAYGVNIAAGTNAQGVCESLGTVRLQANGGTYTYAGVLNAEGGLSCVGEGGTAALQFSGANQSFFVATRYNGHSTQPKNGTLDLQNVDFTKTSSGRFCVGHNDGYTGDSSGIFTTSGGSFVFASGSQGYIGAFSGSSSTILSEMTGGVVFGAGTAPVSLSLSELNIGHRNHSGMPSATGLLDARIVTAGSLAVSGPLRVGSTGNPATGNLLLGTNWTVSAGTTNTSGAVYIGYGGNNCNATGMLSFAKSGSFKTATAVFGVGYGDGNASGRVNGVLLGGTGMEVSIDAGTVRCGSGNGNGKAEGMIDFSASRGGTLLSKNAFYVGTCGGAGSRGEIRLGEDWTVRIGSEGAFATALTIGEKTATGIVSMASGSFQAFVNNLTMINGKNALGLAWLDTGTADFTMCVKTTASLGNNQDGQGPNNGIIDAGASTNAAFFCEGALTLAYSSSAGAYLNYGRIALGRGAGQVGTINMGVNGDPADNRAARLELNGFEMGVTNAISIRRSGKVVATVDGKSAGIGLAPGAVLTFTDTRTYASGPAIDITFAALPDKTKPVVSSTADGILWGFKWAGDHVEDVNAHLTAGRMAYNMSALDEKAQAAAGVFYDVETDATYIGIYTRNIADGTLIRLF